MSELLDESIVSNNHNPDDFREYFGKEEEYYLDQLKREEQGRPASFNIWPFLFGLLWLVYRKLYIYAAIFLAVQFIISLIQEWALEYYSLQRYSGYLELFWMLGFGLIFGFFGNTLYIKKAQRDVALVQQQTAEGAERSEQLRSKGGTNSGGVVIVILVLVIFTLLAA